MFRPRPTAEAQQTTAPPWRLQTIFPLNPAETKTDLFMSLLLERLLSTLRIKS